MCQTADLLSDGIPFLPRQDDPGMIPAADGPQGMDRMEVTDVERVQGTFLAGGERKVVIVVAADHSHLARGHDIDFTRPKSPKEFPIHGIFVKV